VGGTGRGVIFGLGFFELSVSGTVGSGKGVVAGDAWLTMLRRTILEVLRRETEHAARRESADMVGRLCR